LRTFFRDLTSFATSSGVRILGALLGEDDGEEDLRDISDISQYKTSNRESRNSRSFSTSLILPSRWSSLGGITGIAAFSLLSPRGSPGPPEGGERGESCGEGGVSEEDGASPSSAYFGAGALQQFPMMLSCIVPHHGLAECVDFSVKSRDIRQRSRWRDDGVWCGNDEQQRRV